MLDLWVSKAMADNMLLTGEVLQQKWKSFANLAGVPDDECLNLSKGWLSHFKEQNRLKGVKWHGEATSAAKETVEKERSQIQELIENLGYEQYDVFNRDETVLFYV